MIRAVTDASKTPEDNRKPLRVLMVTPIYPTEQQPHSGTFIKSQADSLIAAGVTVEIIHPKPGPVLLRYLSAIVQVWQKARKKQFDIVHGHYGQWKEEGFPTTTKLTFQDTRPSCKKMKDKCEHVQTITFSTVNGPPASPGLPGPGGQTYICTDTTNFKIRVGADQ